MPALVIHTMTGHVALICITVKLHDAYPPAIYSLVVFWTLLWFYLEGVVYTMLGSVNHYSRGFLKSWTDVLGVKSRKKLRSMRPLGIRLGHVYVIHRTTVLFIYLTVMNTTVSVLLMH